MPTLNVKENGVWKEVSTKLIAAESVVPSTRQINGKTLDADITLDASDVGAAPAGYGLGEQVNDVGTIITDLDTALNTGWYKYYLNGSTLNNIAFNGGILRVEGYTNGRTLQTLWPFNQNVILQRFCVMGTWEDWECINPPMVVGVEYRTTERSNSYPVYCKLVNYGSLPVSASKEVSHGITNHHFLRVYGYLDGHKIPIPYTDSVYPANNIVITPGNSAIKITTSTDWGTDNAYVVLYYVKL